MVSIINPGTLIEMKTAAIFLFFLLSLSESSWALNPIRLLVFPLSSSSQNGIPSWVGEGVALAVANQLGSSGVHVIARDERIALLERNDLPPAAQLSRGSMIRVAQGSSADFAIMGSCTGSEKSIRISVWMLDMKTLKLGGEIAASGPLAALPQMENEIAWMILSNAGWGQGLSRETFRERMRKVSNTAYAYYLQSLSTESESSKIRLIEKALHYYEDFPEARFQMGQLYYQNRDYAKAIPYLLPGKSAAYNFLQNEFMLGTCYLQENKPEQAIQAFSQLLHFSKRAEALNNLSIAYMRNGDLASSLQALLEAKNIARSDSAISLNLAILRHIMGNNAAAIDALEEALKAHAENGMLHYMLGFLLKAQGENEKAAQSWAKAKRLGIAVEKLQTEAPQTWARIILGWNGGKTSENNRQ